MNRRASLPGAAELFRSTSAVGVPQSEPAPHIPDAGSRRGSGRQRHDAKITVYVSDDELIDLERVRFGLRAKHSLTADRGRIVREAIAIMLADFDEHGEESLLVRRLRQEPAR